MLGSPPGHFSSRLLVARGCRSQGPRFGVTVTAAIVPCPRVLPPPLIFLPVAFWALCAFFALSLFPRPYWPTSLKVGRVQDTFED